MGRPKSPNGGGVYTESYTRQARFSTRWDQHTVASRAGCKVRGLHCFTCSSHAENILGSVVNFLPKHLLRPLQRLAGRIDTHKLAACVHEAVFVLEGLPHRTHTLRSREESGKSVQAGCLLLRVC